MPPVPHYPAIKYEGPIQAVSKHFSNYHSPALNQILSSLKLVHVKCSFWSLLPPKQLSFSTAEPFIAKPYAAPQAQWFSSLSRSDTAPAPYASAEAIDPVYKSHMSAISQVKRFFLLSISQGIAFIISISSLLLLQLRRAFPARLCRESERQGLLAMHNSDLHAYSLFGQGLVAPASRRWAVHPGFLQLQTLVLCYSHNPTVVLFSLFTLCSLHHFRCGCALRTFTLTEEFSSCDCVGW